MGRRRSGVTARDIERWLRNGFGSGEGKSYKPWLRVSDVPSKGRSKRVCGLKTGRIHHLLSDLEYAIFLLAEYSQLIVDIREQYPLLPYGRTEVIASNIGVRHPVYPKSDTAIVMTHDFMLTMSDKAPDRTPVAISAKYREKAKGKSKRTLEKLEIERRFSVDVGKTKWSFVTEEDFDPMIITNLDWLHYGVRKDLPTQYGVVAPRVLHALRCYDYQKRSLNAVAKDLGGLADFKDIDPLLAFKVAAWRGYLPLDLTSKIGMRHPVREKIAGGSQPAEVANAC